MSSQSKLPDNDGGGGGGGAALGGNDHPDPEMRGAASKNFFRPFGPQFSLKIRGGAGGSGPSPGSANG